ncbi:MAG: Flp pilus assembly complex ATPase component TadA, partial [Gemmatimonadetes bacterium]|nr:Flp pilus assembly complex ATPase component TadA [Gemmatimonadota bacterium]
MDSGGFNEVGDADTVVPVWDRGDSEAVDTGWSDSAYPNEMQEIRTRVHRRLLERLNLANLSERDQGEAEDEVRKIGRDLLASEETPLNLEEREMLVEQVINEVFGIGPLEPRVRDARISDILVNTSGQVYVEIDGKLHRTDVRFRDNRHLMQVIDRIVSAVGRRIDDASPMVDARLADGSRVNAIIPPLAIDGPHVSIRKFRRDALTADDLMR